MRRKQGRHACALRFSRVPFPCVTHLRWACFQANSSRLIPVALHLHFGHLEVSSIKSTTNCCRCLIQCMPDYSHHIHSNIFSCAWGGVISTPQTEVFLYLCTPWWYQRLAFFEKLRSPFVVTSFIVNAVGTALFCWVKVEDFATHLITRSHRRFGFNFRQSICGIIYESGFWVGP